VVEQIGNSGENESQVIVFAGSGIGKTVAAVGIAIRTISAGGKVIFVYFAGPEHPTLGEIKSATAFGGNWRTIGIKSEAKEPSYLDDFTESVDTVEEAINIAQTIWSSECDLLVLDNITHHVACGSVDITRIIDIIDSRAPRTSIVLTGVFAPDLLIDRADVVTNFCNTKQPGDNDSEYMMGD